MCMGIKWSRIPSKLGAIDYLFHYPFRPIWGALHSSHKHVGMCKKVHTTHSHMNNDPLFHMGARGQGNLFPESKVMTWFVQIALGLHYMHTNRVLHRDIKTQNVFILSSGRVVLGDFGISKVMENKGTEQKKKKREFFKICKERSST